MGIFDFIPALLGSRPTSAPAPAEKTEPVLSTPENQQAGPTASIVGRTAYGGHPAAGLTPERLAMILRASITGSPRLYLELAEDIEERYPQYLSVLSTRKRAVKGLEIRVEAAGTSAADKAEADLVREVVESSSFTLSIIDMLDAIGKSFSATEIIWNTKSRPWKPAEFKFRDPRHFEFDRTDPEKLLLIGANGGLEELRPHSWVVHRARAKSGLTIRGGLARPVAWLYFFQSFTLKDWAIFAEAYGQPMRLGKFDPGASPQDKEVLLQAVHSIGSDFAAIIPQAMAVEFVQAQITGSTDLYERRADWLDRQTSKVVLGQTGTTDSSSGSGYAQAKVHDEVREDIVESDAEQLADTLNQQLVIALIDLNFGQRQRSGYPKIIIGRPEQEDIAAWVDHVAKVVPLGVPVTIEEAQNKIGITPPQAGQPLLMARQPSAPAPNEDKKDQTKLLAAAVRAGMPDAVDLAIAETLGNGGFVPLMAPLVGDFQQRLAAATTVEEAQELLAEAFAQLDVSALAEQLAQASFAARLAGELDEDI
ncbi:DUF935 domain-containing protein [Devosia sp.]|uniref:DUF935 domain-containing protein n=1 Tax=Devosia sp. TaxID=1871048 RepID=UPI001AC6B55E|nr:DUF935 domain-containing protein [Devosia sp.]MBN9334705.1 DUF935 domain-containing protein [Devosia sp.]